MGFLTLYALEQKFVLQECMGTLLTTILKRDTWNYEPPRQFLSWRSSPLPWTREWMPAEGPWLEGQPYKGSPSLALASPTMPACLQNPPSWRPLSVPSQLLSGTLLLDAHIPSVKELGRMDHWSNVKLPVGQLRMQKVPFARTKRAVRWIPSRRRWRSSGGNTVVVQRDQTNGKQDFTRLWSWDFDPPTRSSKTHRSPSLLPCVS